MKNYFSSVTGFIKRHKFWSTISLIVLIFIIIFVYKKATTASAQTTYVLGTVQKGTLITTVSGTGQVASTNQVDIKPKVSGDITYVGVQAGQAVTAGTVIARIDATTAAKAVRDAQLSLAAANIAYQKSLQSSQNSVSTTQTSLTQSYDDGFNAMTDAFTGLPVVISDLNNIFYNANHSPYLSNQNLNALSSTAVDYKYKAGLEFDNARKESDQNLIDFKAVSRDSDPATLQKVIAETYQTSKDLSNAEKDLGSLLSLIKSETQTVPAELTTDIATISSDSSKTNGFVTALYNAKTSIETAERTISQQQVSLNGSDSLDIESAKIALAQKQSALVDAETTLADYTIRAPFDGVIGKVSAKVGDSGSTGTAVASIITKQSIATIALNEIDIAKVKPGQKVTLTFGAISDLSISGTVTDVDQIGTVTQGVVSYNVQIQFDTQDDRIKPGMSMSAAIIVDAKTDVLIVPTSAIKTSGGVSTVQVIPPSTTPATPSSTTSSGSGVVLATPPQSVSVQTGSSNDTDTEVVSGLNEGDTIVTRVVTGATASRASSAASTSRGGLFGGGGGGGTRIGN